MSRAPGQWWARWRLNDTGWQPVRVRRYIHGVDHPLETGRMLSVWQGMRGTTRADDPDIEWGDPIPQPDALTAAKAKWEAYPDELKDTVVRLLTGPAAKTSAGAKLVQAFRDRDIDLDDPQTAADLQELIDEDKALMLARFELMHQRTRLPTDHADDCACDWCRRLTKDDAAALVARLKSLAVAP